MPHEIVIRGAENEAARHPLPEEYARQQQDTAQEQKHHVPEARFRSLRLAVQPNEEGGRHSHPLPEDIEGPIVPRQNAAEGPGHEKKPRHVLGFFTDVKRKGHADKGHERKQNNKGER